MTGGITRSCRCRGEDKRPLGAKCPRRSRKDHGSWRLQLELPKTPDGARRPLKRYGYKSKNDATTDLNIVQSLLRYASDSPEALEILCTFLSSLDSKTRLPAEEEVRAKLKRAESLYDQGTVGEMLDSWLPLIRTKVRPNTFNSYESHVRLYLKPKIGTVKRDWLNEQNIQEMFNQIEDDNERTEENNDNRRSLTARIKATSERCERASLRAELTSLPRFRRAVCPTSQRRILATLRKAYNDNIPAKAARNPAAKFSIPAERARPIVWTDERVASWRTTGRRPSPVMVWTEVHAGAFLDYVADHDPEYEAMWHILIHRGLRRGEMAGLPWSDVDLRSGFLSISTQLTEVSWSIMEGPPKSEAGIRSVGLDVEGRRLLAAHRTRQLERKVALGPRWVASDRVFTQPDGAHLRPSWIGKRFRTLRNAAGLPPVRLHDLRHLAATLMLRANIDIKVIGTTLGHASVGTTADIYASVLPTLALESAEATASVVPRRASVGTPGRPSGVPTDRVADVDGGGDDEDPEKPQVGGGIPAA